VPSVFVLLQQRSCLWFRLGFVRQDDYGGGYLVVGVEVEAMPEPWPETGSGQGLSKEFFTAPSPHAVEGDAMELR